MDGRSGLPLLAQDGGLMQGTQNAWIDTLLTRGSEDECSSHQTCFSSGTWCLVEAAH
jgi:hypothetical protein